MHLILALFWLLLGAALLAWHALHPQDPRYRLLGTGLSLGWLGLLFGLYDLARWWSRRTQDRPPPALERSRRRHHPEPGHAPDPAFDFTERPTEEGPGSPPR
jgi:hypothetical protein